MGFITAFLAANNLHRVYNRRIGHVDPSYSGSADDGDFFTISLAFWFHYYFPFFLMSLLFPLLFAGFNLLLAPTEHPGGDSFKPTTMVTQPFPNPHFITPFPYHHSLSPGSLAFCGFPQPSLHCPFLPFPTFSLPLLHYPFPFITTHYLLSSPEQPVRTFNTLVWS